MTWRISRLVYFIANFGLGESLSKSERRELLKYGTDAGAIAKNENSTRVEGFYWYAINLGMYSLTISRFTALKTAKEGKLALEKAAILDPTYHWAGPYRILGRYYQELPPIISFGDLKIAEDYYKKAIEISPSYRINIKYLADIKKNKDEKLKLLLLAKYQPNVDGKIEEIRYQKNIDNDIKETQ